MPKRKNESTEFDYFLKREDYWLGARGALVVRQEDAKVWKTLNQVKEVQAQYEEGALRIVRIPRK